MWASGTVTLLKLVKLFDVNVNSSKLRNFLSGFLLSHVVRLAQFSIHFDKRTVLYHKNKCNGLETKNVIR